MIVCIRNFLYDHKLLRVHEFAVPIISVGNITVGGTGKTPHTEYLMGMLQQQGVNVASLSRGYKRKSKGFVMVSTDTDVYHVGDEPLQVKKKFPQAAVAVAENRASGIQRLLRQEGTPPDVILLDDAYQHRRVSPGINILLINYERPVDTDRLLPVGRLRERAYQKKRANIIIYTKCPHEITPIQRRIILKDLGIKPYQSLYFTTMEYGSPVPVHDEAIPMPDFNMESISVILVAGIANPASLRSWLATKARVADELLFPDHHAFKPKDIRRIIKSYTDHKQESPFLITTEKDAMRLGGVSSLPPEVKARMYYIPIKVVFLQNEEKGFNKKIINYVKSNRSDGRLYTSQN